MLWWTNNECGLTLSVILWTTICVITVVKIWPLWWLISLSTRVQSTLNYIRFVKFTFSGSVSIIIDQRRAGESSYLWSCDCESVINENSTKGILNSDRQLWQKKSISGMPFKLCENFLKAPTLEKMKPKINKSFPSVFLCSEGQQFVGEGKIVYKQDFTWLCLINLKAFGLEFSKSTVVISTWAYFSLPNALQRSRKKDTQFLNYMYCNLPTEVARGLSRRLNIVCFFYLTHSLFQ